MGSKRLITVLLVCLFIHKDTIQANAGNLREERREYQYQRSSKVVGGSGYYNGQAGAQDNADTDLGGWTQSQKEQVQGMAEKLKSELYGAQPGGYYYRSGSSSSGALTNGQGCTTICTILPGFTGQTQEELDIIAKDMTTQIMADLQSGKLARSQMNQPNWFEHQVAQKLIELQKHHQEQYQQNVYRASSRFNQESQSNPAVYIGTGSVSTYNKDTEDLEQQQQQNLFDDDELRQVQQSVFDQRQQQQQGSFYQQQSQNQHSVYTRPVVNRYYNSHTTSRDKVDEEHTRTVYPTPVVITNNVREEKNYTSSSNTAATPSINIYNQYGHREEERNDRQYTRTQTVPTVVPTFDRNYYAEKEHEERQRNYVRPRPYPTTSQTIHTSQTTTSEREHRPPIIIPTQQTITSSNVHVEEEEQIRRQPQYPRVYNHEEKAEQSETYHHNRQTIRPTAPTYRTTYESRNTEQENRRVEVHTPSPVPAVGSRHSIYSHVEESEVVPNYQPRVIIDKNTEFEVLDHRREEAYRPSVVTQTQTTTREREEEERRRQHVNYPRPTTQTTYQETHHEEEENDVQVQVTPRYQPAPSTSQHVITSETEERRTSHRPRYPIHTSHGQTTEQNQSSIYTVERKPSRPIYPSFNTNTTVFENGDSYIRSESHYPTTYVIELTVEEYEERLQRLRDELIRLGYGRLTDEEYNATIATGGFTHNGYKYLYNANSGRYEKTTKIEVNDEEYEAIYETLQQKLRQVGFGSMCDQEVKQTISTGVFIRDGSKFVYNAGKEEYERIEITEEERREIFTRIQEILRRLGYRLLTQRENQGLLNNGYFIRAAHQWIYNIVNGTVQKTIYVGDFAEFTDAEYREIYQKIQDTLKRIGYAQMSESQCNATITSGTFERGGIYWSYNPLNGEFERILLSQDEYRERMHILREELRRIGHKELTPEEYRQIIYQGYFHHGGYRYEFVKQMRRYERIELTAEEYWERLQQLQEQLARIGYGVMSEAQCNSTITSGKFYYGGYEWVYNFNTRDYQMGNKSDIDPTVADNLDKTSQDQTKYDSTKTEENNTSRGPEKPQPRRHHGIISKNRGDQPPQHFDEDYESDEILEEEPGMGYYPTGKKPEVGLATPETFDQIRETTPKPTPPVQHTAPVDYRSELERQRYEKQQTTQTWPPQPQSISERRYHRTQTTYTQTTGVLPQQLATQRSMRHVPGSEIAVPENDLDETNSTPFEPKAVSTEAYLLGSETEKPYNPNDQSQIIERYLRNERNRSPVTNQQNTDGTRSTGAHIDNENSQRNVDLEMKSENLENFNQRFDNSDDQHEEDIQQQLTDLNEGADDFRQELVDLHYNNDDQQQQVQLLETYAQMKDHGQTETGKEYDAEVVQVTDEIDEQRTESPGFWRRLKDKTKDIFG